MASRVRLEKSGVPARRVGEESTSCLKLPPLDPNNRPPTVDAGPAATGAVRSDITLTGSASVPDGDLVLLKWTNTASGECHRQTSRRS